MNLEVQAKRMEATNMRLNREAVAAELEKRMADAGKMQSELATASGISPHARTGPGEHPGPVRCGGSVSCRDQQSSVWG